MIELLVTRVYRMEVEPEWFDGVIEAPITPTKIAEYYVEDPDNNLHETLVDCEVLTTNVLVGET